MKAAIYIIVALSVIGLMATSFYFEGKHDQEKARADENFKVADRYAKEIEWMADSLIHYSSQNLLISTQLLECRSEHVKTLLEYQDTQVKLINTNLEYAAFMRRINESYGN